MIIAGFDIGGTKSEIALLDFDANEDHFEILARQRIPTDRHRPYQEILESLKNLFLATLKEAKCEINEVVSIGIGMPGTIHPQTQKMLNGNSSVFIGKHIANDLKEKIGFPGSVYCENDANCFAYAEARLGAGKEFEKPFHEQTSIGVILGTGCGGGIIVKGDILSGHHGGGGEIGHSELYTDGHACYCGQKGCAEQYLSGPAIEAHFATRIYKQIEKRPSAQEIFELYDKKDPIATAVVTSYLHDLEKFFGTLSNILAPDYFVLGGGVSQQKAIYEYFSELRESHLFIKGYPFYVFQHKLGDSAGVIGAAVIGFERR